MFNALQYPEFAGPESILQLPGGVLVVAALGVDCHLFKSLLRAWIVARLVAKRMEKVNQALHAAVANNALGPEGIGTPSLPPPAVVASSPRDAVVGGSRRAGDPIISGLEARE